ncbi:Mitochondrial carnitine/acylcarnitine carrier protein [Zancudomyces culisetae]|uniref:Mitochondrial carnitine/acylcarnitine carrier protein n=1 Tax=Zancudomyces culisetae TaxID=1213189 RepID=A0A1R1PQA9_ZANCU|nr:Mitochondrial carnitine/acylcarnitine carrier protein [Zancudomyces culisetae]OMH85334.1 Mitochondrial carnitine/acylcarnitine carrier protein [Zancudomyces culisetae]|eukprot:OMH83138.1 Mitochondrial carnitine/acylcarnitine carrier protein [Zancudomyces culisetae]
MSAQKTEKKAVETSALKSFLSGGFGGMSLVAAGYPFDLAKVRMQTSSEYKSALECLTRTIKADGVLGLYRGMFAPLAGATPVFALCFWGYNLGQKIAVKFSGNGENSTLTTGQILFAGGFSAVPTTILMTPMERIKCLLQVSGQGGVSYKGPTDAAKYIYRTAGFRGFYTGTVLTLLRDVPGSVAYFGCYELVKKALIPEGTPKEKISTLAIVVAGGLAGVANWAVAITAPQGKYAGMRDVFVDLVRNEGPKALFKGIGPAMLRAFPANAACFLGVELSLRAMNSIW